MEKAKIKNTNFGKHFDFTRRYWESVHNSDNNILPSWKFQLFFHRRWILLYILESGYSISTAFSGILLGRYVDRTRNMRFVILLNLAVLAFGNLMYSIPYRIWWVIVGRFLCGVNESLQTTVCGKFLKF